MPLEKGLSCRPFYTYTLFTFLSYPVPDLTAFITVSPRVPDENLRGKVQEKALESVQTVARCLSPEQLTGQLVPMLSRLTLKEWYTARMSACCLAPPTYELLPPGSDEAGLEARRKVRELYKRLCLDDTPMVRRCVPIYIS